MLVVVRNHREKLGDVGVEEGAEVGRWLGVVSRAVVGSVREDELGRDGEEARKGEGDVGDWNVVQNNGTFALDHLSISDETNGLKTVHAARASLCHTWDETEQWRLSCSWSLMLSCDPGPIFLMQLEPYQRLLVTVRYRRSSSTGRPACAFPYYTPRGRCSGSESQELDCVW